MPKPPELLRCRCGSQATFDEWSGRVWKNGKVSGGTKIVLCSECFRRGERVVVA